MRRNIYSPQESRIRPNYNKIYYIMGGAIGALTLTAIAQPEIAKRTFELGQAVAPVIIRAGLAVIGINLILDACEEYLEDNPD